MAHMLSVRPPSPLKRSFSDNPYLRSCSPLKDVPCGALREITPRNASACSVYSLGSSKAADWLRGTENTPPLLTSVSLLDLVPEKEGHDAFSRSTDDVPRKRSCGPNRPPPSFSRVAVPSNPHSRKAAGIKPAPEPSSSVPSSPEPMVVDSNTDDDTEFFDLYNAIHIPLPEGRFSDNTGSESHEDVDPPAVAVVVNAQPFRRWMSTLRRRHIHRRKDHISEAVHLSDDTTEGGPTMLLAPAMSESVRRMSVSISSSMGCVTAIKSASMTVASTSIAPRSDAGGFHGPARLGNRSSHYSEVRRSTDSHGGGLGPIIDESAWLRSLQRRKVVEELISSEESYIADLKVLINVSMSLHHLMSSFALTFARTIS